MVLPLSLILLEASLEELLHHHSPHTILDDEADESSYEVSEEEFFWADLCYDGSPIAAGDDQW
jgi:hypothetical protein